MRKPKVDWLIVITPEKNLKDVVSKAWELGIKNASCYKLGELVLINFWAKEREISELSMVLTCLKFASLEEPEIIQVDKKGLI